MKRFIISIFMLAVTFIASAYTALAQEYSVTGRVVDSNQSPVPYTTVALLNDGAIVAGSVTNDGGGFAIAAPANNYTLFVSYIGYNELQLPLELNSDIDLGDILLEASSIEIEAVQIKANIIHREADRFVVDVAHSLQAVGRDAADVLKIAPGVWVTDSAISINGASGTKVYINGRETKMSGAEVVAFLRSMSAEEIQRIEVIPQVGAEFDASMKGGVINITTKRKVETGLMGNASLRTSLRPDLYSIRPSVSLNYNRGKLSLYGRAYGTLSQNTMEATEQTAYKEGTNIFSQSEMLDKFANFGANGGLIYEIDDKQSIGLEVNHSQMGSESQTTTDTRYSASGNEYSSSGDYLACQDMKRTTATMNYIYKLDPMGSEFKVLADYTNSQSPGDNDYHDAMRLGTNTASVIDSVYRSRTRSNYHLATVTASIDKFISPMWQVRAGAKYTFNKNTSLSDHEWYNADRLWQQNADQSYNIGYRENVGAAYVATTLNLGRWSLVGGLRGEYTDFASADNGFKQSYCDLFPNANVSYMLTEDGRYMVIAQYARTILRPNFWYLSPYESKSSEFSVMRGNPNLKATYNNSLSVTTILAYEYSVTVGMNVQKNPVVSITSRDESNPNMIVIMPVNLSNTTDYFANINAPVALAKWCKANVSLMGQYINQQIATNSPARHHLSGMGTLSLSFVLPNDLFVDVDGYYTSSTLLGNIVMDGTGDCNVSLKKRMLNKRLTLSLGVNNIIAPKTTSRIAEEDFTSTTIRYGSSLRRNVSFAVSYRFNSGKKFRAKSVESGSKEDILRLGGN